MPAGAGTALAGVMRLLPTLTEQDVVVVLIPDTGVRYLSKVYNNEWMRDNRYLEPPVALTAAEMVQAKAERGRPAALVTVAPSETVLAAFDQMRTHDFSQVPVFEPGLPVGALYEDKILHLALEGRNLKKLVVREVMGAPFPVVSSSATIDQISPCITHDCPAVFVDLGKGHYETLTKYDLVQAVACLARMPE